MIIAARALFSLSLVHFFPLFSLFSFSLSLCVAYFFFFLVALSFLFLLSQSNSEALAYSLLAFPTFERPAVRVVTVHLKLTLLTLVIVCRDRL